MSFLVVVVILLLGFHSHAVRHPVVYTPGTSGSILNVTVVNQTSIAGCPQSAKYSIYYNVSIDELGGNRLCAHKYLELKVPASGLLSVQNFTNRDGVVTEIPDWGYPSCAAPGQNRTLFPAFWEAGYKPGVDFHVACWDSRLTPEIESPTYGNGSSNASWSQRVVKLIEETYERNNQTPVLLVGHSNGYFFNKYAVDSMSPEWAKKYIAGQISLSGNLVGAPVVLLSLVMGADLTNLLVLPGAANITQGWPVYLATLPDPRAFKNYTLIVDGSNNLTASDYDALWTKLNATTASRAYKLFMGKYWGNRTTTHAPTLALYTNKPMATIGTVRLIAPLALPLANTTGDGVITDHNPSAIGNLTVTGRTCQPRLVDVSQAVGKFVDHWGMITDPDLVAYLVNEVVLKWDTLKVCGEESLLVSG